MLGAAEFTTNKPTLQFGAFGQVVKQMQKALNKRLAQLDTVSVYPLSVPTTGYFDKQTQDAVKYVQCLGFLTVDGIVGPKTWAYFEEGSASLPTLRLGSRGNTVKAVQEVLKASNYYFGAVDGIFGDKTEEAVQVFQAEHLLPVDGAIATLTWNALSKLDFHASTCSMESFGR
ncbi:peptidoglycan-binding domain-containing protein [Iningainema tapete]|uniref:Peptidoglycan-binding protein n=1 Tax=Iningainema tapete BLCC-T55 TaxID=2748662 RepID=A0A8J6XIN2_9CYAN|nr:peptidoglycan-binding protein [Iningainema tapete]MBD2775148.1 peptidoglycan-binding protein [Iningainema tapete BLCC-T55]